MRQFLTLLLLLCVPIPVVADTIRDAWGTYDPERWVRQCSNPLCQMCASRDAVVAARRASAPRQEIQRIEYQAQVAPTREEVITEALKLLDLNKTDVFVDYGCGDARVLIEAVKQYGCRAVGIERDADQFQKAFVAVMLAEQAGEIPKHSISLVYGDVRDFKPSEYGASKAYAHLFTDVLEDLKPQFDKLLRTAIPFHGIDGAQKRGNVWLYTSVASKPQPAAPVAAKPAPQAAPQRVVVGYRPVKYCQNGRCFIVNEPIYEYR